MTLRFSVLLLVVIVSALAVVYAKYKSRQLFGEIRQLERQLYDFEVEWGQLQLEQTTWAERNRIERLAHKRLKMVVPSHDSITYLRLK